VATREIGSPWPERRSRRRLRDAGRARSEQRKRALSKT